MTAFATPNDMILRYDTAVLGALVVDSNTAPLPPAGLPTDPVMLESLDDATGELMSILEFGERYTLDELLVQLTEESRQYLARLCCMVAFRNLWMRKPATESWEESSHKAETERAEVQLEALRKGKVVLHLQPQIEASRANIETIGAKRIADNWGLVVDRSRGRYLPRRRSFKDR